MKKHKQFLSILMVIFLIFPNTIVPVVAEKNDQIDWSFDVFGSNTSKDRNPNPTYHEDGAITLEASGGKVARTDEGISFYSTEISSEMNFEIKTNAKVISFNSDASISTPNQKSFGLMLKDEKGTDTSNYIAVGALDTVMKGFYKQEELSGDYQKLDPFDNINPPTTGEEYELIIKKVDETYELSVNGVREVLNTDNLFSDNIFVGFYVARDAKVMFNNTEIKVDARQVDNLEVDTSRMKTEYLLGEELDLSGLEVVAEYSDGQKEELSEEDYIISGFNSNQPGVNTIVINYNGVTKTIDINIRELTVTNMEIKYFPAKTTYYKGDTFESAGLVVEASYDNGYKITDLKENQYKISIEDDYVFEDIGIFDVTVYSTETEGQFTTFNVEVLDADLVGLEIRREPIKTHYFKEEDLDLSGLSVYAIYDDHTEVRLSMNDYEVSNFDSNTIGDKEVVITYKDQFVILYVTVKEKELEGIEVTEYPQTTYEIGEDFNRKGLVVSKVFDNGEREVLEGEDYQIDESSYDPTIAGVYDLHIIPNDKSLDSIMLKVTVREKENVHWNEIRFGQSTSSNNNTIEKLDNDIIRIAAKSGAGKITGDHDGITFYYTEIDAQDNFTLSADVFVEEFARPEPDGQEAFGIMARDAIGSDNNSAVFASNIAAIGGFNSGSRSDVGTVLFARTGVLSSDGEGSKGVQRKMLLQERPNAENTAQNYRLTLSKTNSGFVGKLNDDQEEVIFEPDILSVQDQDKLYVGFFTARLATIQVSNIELTVTEANTDAPKVEPPVEPVKPNVNIISLDKTSDLDYKLLVETNVDGLVSVRQGQNSIATYEHIKGGDTFELMTEINDNGDTNFSVVFLPDDTQYLTDYNQIVQNFTVTMKTFANKDGNIYVSPEGTSKGDGSKENPLDIDTAIEFVKKGQKIVVQEGVYKRNTSLDIKRFNDGTEAEMKYLIADPSATERPLIDFDKKGSGMIHSGNYWHVEGIDFARAANSTGYRLGGSYNVIRNISTFENGGTGFQISRTSSVQDEFSKWPAYNLVENSLSYDNIDPAENGADGFAAKLTVGDGNVFRGNVSHNNIDDGWDLYTKVGTGAIGAVTIENSITFNNGQLTNGYQGSAGKNGFKLGGEGVHVPHVIKNNLAFSNEGNGYTSNSNPGVIAENNIGLDNGTNLSFTTYGHITPDFTVNGFASIQTDSGSMDRMQGDLDSEVNYMFNGMKSVNALGEELSDELLNSLENLFVYDEEGNIVSVKRNKNGEIQWGDVWKTYGKVVGVEQPDEQDPIEPADPEAPEHPDPVDPTEPQDPENSYSEDPSDPIDSSDSQNQEKQEDPIVDTDKQEIKDPLINGNDVNDRLDGQKLPKTATDMYNHLLLGLILIVFGACSLGFIYRKYSK